MLQVAEAYSDFDPLHMPPVKTMGMSMEKPLVGSKFGLVQTGNVLSYSSLNP